MTQQELQKIGFISQEQYDSVIKTLQSDLTGEFAGGGGTGARPTASVLRKAEAYFKAYATEGEMWTTRYSVGKYPAKVDLTANMPPVFDQGSRGSCVGQAVTGLANYYFGREPVLSAEYTYGMLKKFEYAAYAEAYRRFLDDPGNCQRAAAEKALQLRDFESDSAPVTTQWYLEHRFPYLLERACLSRVQAAAEAHEQPNLEFSQNELQALIEAENPARNDGSFLAVACRVFRKEGFCTHDVLPYSFQEIPDNRGHLPMPEEAKHDAASRRITDELYYFRSPGSVDEIKKFLSGNNGRWEPMPVAVSVCCFASWMCSPFTRKNGWFSMPIPDENKAEAWAKVRTQCFRTEHPESTDEECVQFYLKTLAELLAMQKNAPRDSIRALLEDVQGCHAMLVVGYADEPLVAGGGYFLVRNSWTGKWGWDSDHPGHAKIPYAYIEYFCSEALSIIKPVRKESPAVPQPSRERQEKPDAGELFREPLPAAEIKLVPLTDDPDTRREALHLTHRLVREGYQVRLETDRLPEGKLRDRLAARPDELRDVILLAGQGRAASAAAGGIAEEIVRFAESGRNVVSVQLGKSNADLLNALPKSCGKLISYNRIKIHESSFDDDFAELKMRLKSSPRKDLRQGQALYEAFRKILKQTSSKVADGTDEHVPDLYEVLRKNMSFRFLEALVRYLLRKGFRLLDARGNRVSSEQAASALAAGGRQAIVLVPESGRGRLYIKFDKKSGKGTVLQDTVDEKGHREARHQGLYRCLKWLFTPVASGIAADDTKPCIPVEIFRDDTAAPEPLPRNSVAAVTEIIGRSSMQEAETGKVDEAVRMKNRFFSGVDSNICRLDVDYCFPDLDLPLSCKLLPWKLQVKEVLERECRQEDLVAELEKQNLVAPEDRELTEKTCGLRLYELKNGGISVMIIAAYVTLWKNGKRIPADALCLEALRQLRENLKKSMQNLYCPRLSGVGLLIGSGDAAVRDAQRETYRKNADSFRGGNGEFVLFSDYDSASDKWSFIFPAGWDGYYWWRFAEHLLPTDPALCLKELIRNGNYGNSATKERLEKNLGLPHALFAAAFARLKPMLRKRPGTEKEAEPEYELDPAREHDITCSVSGSMCFRTLGWNYVHCVIYSGAFALGGIIAGAVNAHVAVRVLILGFTSLVAKTIVEWHDRWIKHE